MLSDYKYTPQSMRIAERTPDRGPAARMAGERDVFPKTTSATNFLPPLQLHILYTRQQKCFDQFLVDSRDAFQRSLPRPLAVPPASLCDRSLAVIRGCRLRSPQSSPPYLPSYQAIHTSCCRALTRLVSPKTLSTSSRLKMSRRGGSPRGMRGSSDHIRPQMWLASAGRCNRHILVR